MDYDDYQISKERIGTHLLFISSVVTSIKQKSSLNELNTQNRLFGCLII